MSDTDVPTPVRRALSGEFARVQAMLDKLEHGQIHIAVFGRVGVGKSALLNALLGEPRFATSPLHGETKDARMAHWRTESGGGGVYLIDTPGINEVDGEARRLARELADAGRPVARAGERPLQHPADAAPVPHGRVLRLEHIPPLHAAFPNQKW